MVYLHPKFVTICLLLVLGVFVLAGNPSALAHGEIEHSDPAADAIIPAAPPEVHIWFSQELFRFLAV